MEGPTTDQAETVRAIGHWIDGRESAVAGSRTSPVFDPALGAVTAQVALAEEADARAAIDAAARAGEAWGAVSIAKRQAVIFRFRELIVERRQQLAELITSEHGKVVSDALGEVQRGIEVVELACGAAHHLRGGYTAEASTGVDVHSMREPLGVVAIISPFNFPAMVPMWFFPIAIASGNSVILKPSEKDPSAALWIARLWQEAGLPDGVFNVLQGNKAAVDALLDADEVQAISFVGSTPIARYIYERAAKGGKRVQALGGAKNHMVVMPDADLDLVADQAVSAGFGSAGERCMAVSVIVAVDPVGDALIAKISERIDDLKVGDGRREADMGPLITREHRDRVAGYLDSARDDGAVVVVDGRERDIDGDPNGFWLGPCLLDRVPVESGAYRDEIFGPVLSVVRVASFDEAIDLINAGPFGNGSAVFTNDGGVARRFQREVHAGMVGVNVAIPVPVAYFSFGGWKHSLFGDSKAYGEAGFQFFTREKVVTTRWLDPALHGGVSLGFPTA